MPHMERGRAALSQAGPCLLQLPHSQTQARQCYIHEGNVELPTQLISVRIKCADNDNLFMATSPELQIKRMSLRQLSKRQGAQLKPCSIRYCPIRVGLSDPRIPLQLVTFRLWISLALCKDPCKIIQNAERCQSTSYK